MPSFVAAGTFDGDNTGADLTPGQPSGVTQDDVCLMLVEIEDEETLTVPSGWAHVSGSPQASGSGASHTKLNVLWRVYQTGDPDPVTVDVPPVTGGSARIAAFRNVHLGSDPWDVIVAGADAVFDTSLTITGGTTTVDNCMVVLCVSNGRGSGTGAEYSAWSNGDLASFTERFDNGGAGTGGMIAMVTGEKAAAGVWADTTPTLAIAVFNAFLSVALKEMGEPPPTLRVVQSGMSW